MSIDSISRREWEQNLDLWRTGMGITLPQLYYLPSTARVPHGVFVDRLQKRRWGFILVQGETGGGKSAYRRYVQNIAIREGYAIAEIEIREAEARLYSPAAYFNKQIMERLRLPDGRSFLHTLFNDDPFRQHVHELIDANASTLSFWSPALLQAFLLATSPHANKERELARSWLRGEAKYVVELRELGIHDPVMKSVSNIPSDKLLFFMRQLSSYLGATGFLLAVDEIESLGYLSPAKGKQSLSLLRDFINILTDEGAEPTKRGLAEGLFIIYAISIFYLGYSGVVSMTSAALRARAERYGIPNVRIDDIPRLVSILKHSASAVITDFTSLDDLIAVALNVVLCYEKANDYHPKIDPAQLAQEVFDRTGSFVARDNIQEMIRALDKERTARL